MGLIGTETQDGVQVAYAGIALLNKANACGLAQENSNVADAQLLLLFAAAAGPSLPTGSYPLGMTTEALFDATDAKCNPSTETGSSGTVTFSTLSSSEVAGSFEVTFPSGDHLTGKFSAPVCSLTLAQFMSSGTATACMP